MSRNESGDRVRGVIGRPGDQIVIHTGQSKIDEELSALSEALADISTSLTEILELLGEGERGDRLLDSEEVAELMGATPRTIYRRMAKGLIGPGMKIGAHRRWWKSDVLDALQQLKEGA